MAFNETDIINQVALQEAAIGGVKNSYSFSQNPDNLTPAMLPAVLHYIPNFDAEPRGNFNSWTNTIEVRSILCVVPRPDMAGRLKFLENEAIPYGGLWRTRFQTATTITTLLTNTGAVKAFLTRGEYGAGGNLLRVGNTDFVGWIFYFQFVNA